MNPEIKAQWVEALRSGDYKQTTMELRDSRGAMCCLGVLCDLYIKESGKRWNFAGMKWQDYKTDEGPGPEVCIWAGLPNENPRVRIGKDRYELSGHNDGGRTFAQIADAIEKQL